MGISLPTPCWTKQWQPWPFLHSLYTWAGWHTYLPPPVQMEANTALVIRWLHTCACREGPLARAPEPQPPVVRWEDYLGSMAGPNLSWYVCNCCTTLLLCLHAVSMMCELSDLIYLTWSPEHPSKNTYLTDTLPKLFFFFKKTWISLQKVVFCFALGKITPITRPKETPQGPEDWGCVYFHGCV